MKKFNQAGRIRRRDVKQLYKLFQSLELWKSLRQNLAPG
jgi:hypothetical protein